MSSVTNIPNASPPFLKTDQANSNTPVQVQAGQTNLYGYTVDNFEASAIYLVFFDKDSAPTPGVDEEAVAFKIEANAWAGRDPSDWPLRHFSKGCWVVASSAPDGTGVLVTPPDLQIWSK